MRLVRPASLMGAGLAILTLAWADPAERTYDAVFTRLEIVAHLDNAGLLHVAEDQTVEMRPSVEKLSRDFGIGAGQRIVLTGLWRIDEQGQRVPLAPAKDPKPDEYAFYPTWIRWTPPAAAGSDLVTHRYRLEYDLVNAVVPAWDLPNGDKALDGLHDSFWRPDERAKRLVPVWREAWPGLTRRYRLDHDVLFPGRDDTGPGMNELHYQLAYDNAWSLVDEDRDIGVPTPRVDYRVRRTLEYRPAGRPPGVNLLMPALRMVGFLLCVPLAGIVLRLASAAFGRLMSLGAAPTDVALFESAAMAEPPEVSAQRLRGDVSAPTFEDLIVRLATERRLSLEVPERTSEDEILETRLRLQVEREKLHPYEREVVDALFGSAREVTPAELRKRAEPFDGDEAVDAAFARAKLARPRPSFLAKGLGLLLFFGGVALCVLSLTYQYVEVPYALFAGVGAGFLLTAIPLPLLLLIVLVLVLGLVPNVPMHPAAYWGISLLLLAGYAARRFSIVSRRDDVGRRYDDLRRAYLWAAGELKKPRPALRDAWLPHLQAYGLSPQIEAWRKRYGGTPAMGAPDLSEMGSQAIPTGPPFTGVAPARRFPADEEWAAGFMAQA